MIAVDTNVLVRILVDDPGQPAQVKAARRIASKAERVFVPLIVQVETVWVLESAYELPKLEIIRILEHLVTNDAFSLEFEDLCDCALHSYQGSNADYADCVILAGSIAKGLALHTFDKRLGRMDGAELVNIRSSEN